MKVNGSIKTYTALIESEAADSIIRVKVTVELNLDFKPVQNVQLRGIYKSSQLNTQWAAEGTCKVYESRFAMERYLVVNEKCASTDFIMSRPSLWNNRMILQKDKIIIILTKKAGMPGNWRLSKIKMEKKNT